MATAPYGALERDLCRVAGDRCAASLESVLQLCETPEQKLMVAMHASQVLLATCSGIYAAKNGIRDLDPVVLGQSVLQLMKENRRG